jgi:ribonuclease HI
MSWAIELTQYDISYEPRIAIKVQVLADFLVEMTHPREHHPGEWTIYVDGSSNNKGYGDGVILENTEGVAVEYSLKSKFQTSNNQAEYEACLPGIRMAKELGATAVTICLDSRLIVSQIKGEYQTKEQIMQKYLTKVRDSLVGLSKFEIKHISREQNARADLLSILASTKKASNYHYVIEEAHPSPSLTLEVGKIDWRAP